MKMIHVAVDIDKIIHDGFRDIDGAHIITQNRDVRVKMLSRSVEIKMIQQALL